MEDSFEDLLLEEAIAWARERPDQIIVRVGYGPSYAIGFECESRLPWPSGGLPAPVRRRASMDGSRTCDARPARG